MKTWILSKNVTVHPFSREATNFLKGIAILLIALHNYYRWVLPITGENEFNFSSSCLTNSLLIVGSNPLEFVNVFFNLLGHYGVQAFMVISAYGLTLSYQQSRPQYGQFVLHRFDKLYPAFVFAAFLYFVFQIIFNAQIIGTDTLANLGIQLSLFSNFFPGKALTVCGPWWFYSFIFQFYLVFPLIMWLYSKAGVRALAGLVLTGYLFTLLMYGPMTSVGLNPLTLFMGHLPEFCFGIFLAVRKEVRIPVWVLILAFLLFAGGNAVSWLWPFASLGTAVLLVVLIQKAGRVHGGKGPVISAISFVGVISMYLFSLHGFLRSPFVNLANSFNSPGPSLILGIMFLLFSIGIAYAVMITEKSLRKWISQPAVKGWRYGRFLILAGLVLGSVTVLMVTAHGGVTKEEKAGPGNVIFSATDDFEKIGGNDPARYSDSVFFGGKRGLLMYPPESFSSSIEVDFSKINVSGLYEADASVMLFTTDTLAAGSLVLEVHDSRTGELLDWQSQPVPAEKFVKGKWFPCTYKYIIPKGYLYPVYKIRIYVWDKSKGRFYADDLKLELKAKK